MFNCGADKEAPKYPSNVFGSAVGVAVTTGVFVGFAVAVTVGVGVAVLEIDPPENHVSLVIV